MHLPMLEFTDITLLLAVGSIVLLITAELSSCYYGSNSLKINRQKLKNDAYATGIVFIILAVVKIVTLLQ